MKQILDFMFIVREIFVYYFLGDEPDNIWYFLGSIAIGIAILFPVILAVILAANGITPPSGV